MPERMPALFVGHGNPMNALADNAFTRRWAALGASLPRPRAILSISAHWYVSGSAVTVTTRPRTLHDFGGFPPELYQVRYPAPGDVALAARVERLLAPVPVGRDHAWGLDHGTWSVLRHVYPEADIPVVQLSIDARQPPPFHFSIGQRLAPLREEGVLILGSGNVVHNLRAMSWEPASEPYPWAAAFEARVREQLLAGEGKPLVEYATRLGPEAELSVPTPDHYLPLLYVAGTRVPADAVIFPVDGVDAASISMLAVQVG